MHHIIQCENSNIYTILLESTVPWFLSEWASFSRHLPSFSPITESFFLLLWGGRGKKNALEKKECQIASSWKLRFFSFFFLSYQKGEKGFLFFSFFLIGEVYFPAWRWWMWGGVRRERKKLCRFPLLLLLLLLLFFLPAEGTTFPPAVWAKVVEQIAGLGAEKSQKVFNFFDNFCPFSEIWNGKWSESCQKEGGGRNKIALISCDFLWASGGEPPLVPIDQM